MTTSTLFSNSRKFFVRALLPFIALFAMFTAAPVWAGGANAVVTIPVGNFPGAVGINLSTNKIYVVNYFSNSVTVIDGAKNTTTSVPVGQGPRAIAVNPVTHNVYVLNVGAKTVTVIDGANNTSVVSVDGYPYNIEVNPDTNKIYVLGGDGMTVINGVNNSTVKILGNATAMAISKNRLYVLGPNATVTGSIVRVMDAATDAVVSTVDLGAESAYAIAANSGTDKIYIAGASRVTVLDGATNSINTIAVGSYNAAMAINQVTNKIYIVNRYGTDNTVKVIDGATNTTTAVVAGWGPYAIEVNPRSNIIIVPNRFGNDVTLIDGESNSTSSVPVGFYPVDVAVNPKSNKAYVVCQDSDNVSVLTVK